MLLNQHGGLMLEDWCLEVCRVNLCNNYVLMNHSMEYTPAIYMKLKSCLSLASKHIPCPAVYVILTEELSASVLVVVANNYMHGWADGLAHFIYANSNTLYTYLPIKYFLNVNSLNCHNRRVSQRCKLWKSWNYTPKLQRKRSCNPSIQYILAKTCHNHLGHITLAGSSSVTMTWYTQAWHVFTS